MQPERLGPYRIDRRIAAGGMAEVFVAHRLGPHGFQKRVALKRILPQHARDPEFVGMFIDEARLAARLAHPNIVSVFDFGEAEGSLFMAMEMVEGTTVGRLLRTAASRLETVPLCPALHIAHEASGALAYAHNLRDDQGKPLSVVHRDVSPANLLLDHQGRVKLTDFGIARCRTTAQRTDDGHIRGKLGYMSPEQVVGEAVDGRSDVFTLSVVLAELLIAEPLFGVGGDLDVLIQIRNVDLATLMRAGRHIPQDVMQLIEWGLTRERDKRPKATEFHRTVTQILARRGELGRGPIDLARLLERMELIDEADVGPPSERSKARPTLLVEMRSSQPAPDGTRELLDSLNLDPPTIYALRAPDGKAEDAVSYSEMVRRIVTGQLKPGTRVRRDDGRFELAGRVPELRRYFRSKALQWGPEGLPQGASQRGVLEGGRLLSQLYWITRRRETGVVHLWTAERRKKIYYREGRLDFVASNCSDELLGEFLVSKGIILRMELEMALALLSRYEGRLGDALVGLGVLRPMQLYQAVVEQVRSRFLQSFHWQTGQWAYVQGERCDEETFALPIGEHELLRDAALEADHEQMKRVLDPLRTRPLSADQEAQNLLHPYRVSNSWERLFAELDGRHTLASLLSDESAHGLTPGEVERALYFGLSCDLVRAA